MKRKITKPDPKAAAQAKLDELHTRLEAEYPSFTWWRRPNCITLEGATLSYLMYCIPVAGRDVVDCRDRNGIYTSHKGYGDKTADLPLPIAGMSVAWFPVEPLGKGYPLQHMGLGKDAPTEAKAPRLTTMYEGRLTTMYEGKEVEYEICNPTPEAVALIEQAAAEHQAELDRRHKVNLFNIDMRLLKEQKGHLVRFLGQLNGPRMLQDKKVQTQITKGQADAMHGILHLLDAVQDNAIADKEAL